ncbi:DEAD/DEAH box helicase family protein [Heyndrickxia sp. FSL K6-6286]|uniref:DEAD/DEAH box helicase n=1 Tax=Heyndrickxia sp. FSL K6-6286 TaxID=2921510 RepID=UPI00315B172B
MTYFQENYTNIYFSKATDKTNGLRNAQLGAIHAIGSYFTRENKNKALIVLPTGTGKTAVLMMSPYILESKKVLIITPSILVRNQIAENFSELKTLKHINVLPEICMSPIVFELTDTKVEDHIERIIQSDVVVATPQGAWNISMNPKCSELFDLVLVDEAHHEPAKKWREALENFSEANKILFTATPFRLDNKKLQADLIYRYSLSQAYKDKVFGEVKFIPIKIENKETKDIEIALETEKIFFEDKSKGLKHSLMVRAGSIEEAKILYGIYKENTELNLEIVHSRLSAKTIRNVIKKLLDSELDGVVCVDMMAEGFDFPNLKIAAIHSPHKSLAITLQFIGRFARTNASEIGEAKFIAVNDEEFILENHKLFSSDAVWKDIIINLSETQITDEEENQRFINKFTPKLVNRTEISNEIINMRPNFHAKIFHTVSFNIHADFPEVGFKIESLLINTEDNTVIAILSETVVPKWATRESGIYDNNFYLIVMHYSPEFNLLFINSQLKSENLYTIIASSYCGENQFYKLSRNELHKVLGDMENFEIFNSGLQNRVSNEESYVINSGPDVSNTFDPATGKLYAAGHVFCKAQKDGVDYTLGYSSGSKIWSSTYGSIKEFVEWCNISATKIKNQRLIVKTNTAFDFVPIPEKIIEFPNTIFLIRWASSTYSNPRPLFLDEKVGESTILDLDISLVSITKNEIKFKCKYKDTDYLYALNLEGNITSLEEDELLVQVGRRHMKISEYLVGNPVEFLTTDLCLISDSEIAKNNIKIENFVPILIEQKKWSIYNTDIELEFGKPKKKGFISIHDALEVILKGDGYEYLIYDHGTGEIADYIGIITTPSEINIHFYHVKAMKAKTYNNSVNDLYDVLGQAIKSVIWLKSKSVFRNKLSNRRDSGYCQFILGDFDTLKSQLLSNKIIKAKIIAVQPSIKKNLKMTEKIAELLAATNHYIKHSGSANEFEIWGS